MRIVRNWDRFFSAVHRQVYESFDDTAAEARRNLGNGSLSRTVQVQRTGHLAARVGSNHPGAKAQEVGAYITPKSAKALRFASGKFSKRARIRGKRWLKRAGPKWHDHLTRRLRGVR